MNHAFIDGNKRTALACCLVFLSFNDIDIEAEPAELEELTVATAEGRKEKFEIADFLRSHQVVCAKLETPEEQMHSTSSISMAKQSLGPATSSPLTKLDLCVN
jgi:hypothetical protein